MAPWWIPFHYVLGMVKGSIVIIIFRRDDYHGFQMDRGKWPTRRPWRRLRKTISLRIRLLKKKGREITIFVV
jgi:hypothetical protein